MQAACSILSWPDPLRLGKARQFLSRTMMEPRHMKHVPKETTDDDLIQQFLNKGGKVTKGKTKPMPDELGLSNNVWGNKLTREEKAAKKADLK